MSRIKNELRTRMTQRRLNMLYLMAIKFEPVQEFDDLINDCVVVVYCVPKLCML